MPLQTLMRWLSILSAKKTLSSSLLIRPAAESHGSIIEDAIPWEVFGTNFITQFTEGRKKSVTDKS